MTEKEFKKKWSNHMPHDESLLEFERDVDNLVYFYLFKIKPDESKSRTILFAIIIGTILGYVLSILVIHLNI